MFSNNLAISWHLLGDFGKYLAVWEECESRIKGAER